MRKGIKVFYARARVVTCSVGRLHSFTSHNLVAIKSCWWFKDISMWFLMCLCFSTYNCRQFISTCYVIHLPIIRIHEKKIISWSSIYTQHTPLLQPSTKAFLHIQTNILFQLRRVRICTAMAIRQMLRHSLSSERRSAEVPKGHVAVYIGENEKRRFVIPVSYLNHSSFQELLFQAEEEFGFHHPMGGITIPCSEDLFTDVVSSLRKTWLM